MRTKLILPYVVLTLLMASLGLFVTTRLVVASVRERFLNQLNQASRVTADGIVRFEEEQLNRLRRLVFTVGVAEAILREDIAELEQRLLGTVINDRVDLLTVVNREGRELRSFIALPDGTNAPSMGADLSREELVSRVLAGQVDRLGDKYAGIRALGNGLYLITSAPVKTSDDEIIGVMLIGTRLERILTEVKAQGLAEIVLLTNDGSDIIGMTLPDAVRGRDQLLLTTAEAANLNPSRLDTLTLDLRGYEALYAPLIIRRERVGILAVLLPNDYVVATETASRGTFIVLFALITLVLVLAGIGLYQNIVRPLMRLRDVSQAIAGGDLEQRSNIARRDEIGELARAFDDMAARLRERTAEARRLYEETVERNQQLQDINLRLQSAQLQLIQSEKLAAVGQLTAGIVHDVKNPLAVIRGLAEILQEEPGLSNFVREQLTNIRDNASRANAIVNDLLTFARQSTPEFAERDLRETVQAALRLTEYLVRKGRVRASLELPAEPVKLFYDAQQIEQVLINLIQNAVQAMPNGGQLVISLSATDGLVTLSVRDTGVGIPPENLRRIFDPFFTTKGADGTGLGLSVSYGIIARHHGRIEVESTVGQGTIFIITLPVKQPESPPAGA
ncbi:MAG: ATP-binding protein [Anaerolineales bacterium]|nr:ATP-binding protein [Anaerolineales bacterium]